MKLNLQKDVICFIFTNIFSVEGKMNEAKKYNVKIKTSEKWNFSKSIPLWYLLSEYHCLTIWKMENNITLLILFYFIYQFQFGYIC